jgi:hypothetical protein
MVKSIFNRKLILVILFILIVFRTLDLPCFNPSKPVSKTRTQRIRVIEYTGNTAAGILQRLQFQFEQGVDTNLNCILIVFAAWRFILVLLFVINVPVIDRRKQIIKLITLYFEGSKYKNIFSFQQ